MPIPTYEDCMLPLLEASADGGEHAMKDLTASIAMRFELSEQDRSQFLPSGQQTVIANRVGWAKTYLKKAGLLDNPRRGIVRITKSGADALARKPAKIDNEFLSQFPAFVEYKERAKAADAPPAVFDALTPEESLASSYLSLRSALADELLERVKNCSPGFFERLVVELLVAMGYGGSLADAGQVVGRVGDGGIDGVIKEDKLGLDIVCIQAKRWENTVSRPDVQRFAGSMDGFRASKGGHDHNLVVFKGCIAIRGDDWSADRFDRRCQARGPND